MVAAVKAAKAAPAVAKNVQDNAGLYLIGGIAAWWLLQQGVEKALGELHETFVKPFKVGAEKSEYVVSETTKGAQFWGDDFWTVENMTRFDVPFSDREIPLIGGVSELDRPSYWLEFDVPGSDVQVPLAPGLIKEQDESWAGFASTIDIPGLPEYDVRDAPGDILGAIKFW